MSYLIDDIARTLAGPMPRRKAFRLILGTVLGGRALTEFGLINTTPLLGRIV